MENTTLFDLKSSESTLRKFQKSKPVEIDWPVSPPVIIESGLEPYAGEFGYTQARHLLSRTIYGPTRDQIEESIELGLGGTIAGLFQPVPDLTPPLNYDNELDPFTPIGQTWIDKPTFDAMGNYRRRSLRAWHMGAMIDQGMSIKENMIMFWHNHFVTSDSRDAKFEYQYLELIRQHATGNFRELTKEMTLNPAMLVYLNGNQNTRFAPNENFARELFELFTVGKGDLVDSGDYTTFTEDDVRAAARILTGWRVQFLGATGDLPTSYFTPNRHDQESKVLSHRFDEAIISNNGDQEYADLIDVIFNTGKPAEFLARKLYRWFVYYRIDESIEANVIQPLAQIILDHDFEIRPALETLFASAHFHDVNSIGCQIKSPIDFFISNIRQFELEFPEQFRRQYVIWYGVHLFSAVLQMEFLSPPSVAGWMAFYQGPTFNRLWINSVTLPLRLAYIDAITITGFDIVDSRFGINVLDYISRLTDPLNPEPMIREIGDIALPNGLTDNQVAYAKEVLIPGLPDDEWTIEYTMHLNNPEDEEIQKSVEAKLRQMFQAIIALPEYHLQ